MSQLERFKGDLKLASHRDWVETYRRRGSNYPITLEVDPTNRCPLDCDHCVWKEFRQVARASLSSEDLITIVDQAKDIGVRSIIWTGGGDPLSSRGTVPAIEYATARGIKSAMFTSAVPMTPRVSDVLVDHLSWVRFHLDGATPESYSRNHRVPKSVFNKVVDNIGYFTEKKAEVESKSVAGIGMVALESSLDEVADMAALAKDLRLDYFQYKHDLTRMRDGRYLGWWEDVAQPKLDELSRDLEDGSFKVQYSRDVEYRKPDRSPLCHVHHLSTAITADGNVAYCKATRDQKEWYLGNIHTQTLKEIFDGERHRSLREKITPENCGIVVCPMKKINMLLQMVEVQDDINLIGPEGVVEHSEFI